MKYAVMYWEFTWMKIHLKQYKIIAIFQKMLPSLGNHKLWIICYLQILENFSSIRSFDFHFYSFS